MEKSTENEWDEWDARYKRERSEKSKAVYADLTLYSIWGITIVFSLLIYSWQGWAEYYNRATPESTYFNQVTVVLLVAFSIIVTILYINIKSNRKKID